MASGRNCGTGMVMTLGTRICNINSFQVNFKKMKKKKKRKTIHFKKRRALAPESLRHLLALFIEREVDIAAHTLRGARARAHSESYWSIPQIQRAKISALLSYALVLFTLARKM